METFILSGFFDEKKVKKKKEQNLLEVVSFEVCSFSESAAKTIYTACANKYHFILSHFPP